MFREYNNPDRKCKYCPKPAAHYLYKSGKFKRAKTTCGSPECLSAQYKSNAVNNLKAKHKEKHHKWLPIGTTRLAGGYIFVKVSAVGSKHDMWRRQHEVVAEEILGRPLQKGEVVHHINMDKIDNRPENIYVYKDNPTHIKHHGELNMLIAKLLEEGQIGFTDGSYHVL